MRYATIGFRRDITEKRPFVGNDCRRTRRFIAKVGRFCSTRRAMLSHIERSCHAARNERGQCRAPRMVNLRILRSESGKAVEIASKEGRSFLVFFR